MSNSIDLEWVWIDAKKYAAPAEVYEQVVVADIFIVCGAIFVLVLIDLYGIQNVSDDRPKVDATLGVAAASLEGNIERLVPGPVGVRGCRGLEESIHPFDLFVVAADGRGARVVRKDILEAVCTEAIVLFVASETTLGSVVKFADL